LIFHMIPGYNQNNQPTMPTLYVYPKRGETLTIPLGRGELTIGRSTDNTLALPDPFCSSRHAVLVQREGRYLIRDAGSKNGIFVNGKRVIGEVEIRPGDEILLGQTRLSLDRQLLTNVEVSDGPQPSTSFNTIMRLNEILKKPVDQPATRALAKPEDLERIRAEHRMYAVMTEVSRALLLHRPLGELLDYIMDLICQNLPMDRGVLLLKEGSPEQLIPKVVRINEPSLKNQKMLLSQTIVNMAYEQQLAVRTLDASTDPRFKARDSIITSHIHSAACVPLWNNERVIGIIYADRIQHLDQFSEEDLRLLTLLSNLAAVKIENARQVERALEKERMDKELALAAQIQRDFMPKDSPLMKGFEVSGLNLPCFEVGGDYFDFIPIDHERMGIVVADVSGKGVSAALLMASLRASLHTELNPGYNLTAMTGRLNEFVHRSSAANSFITFIFCELNLRTGEVRYVNAGHNPPVVLNGRGKTEHLDPCGLCLGMFPGSAYEAKQIKVESGDIILIFTDGLTESRNSAGQELGEERIIDFLRRNLHRPANDILQELKALFLEFTAGVDPFDDTTLVIIKRTA
jgi:sigma-B regulation protein RsbU (phosphoserine phosphatase)